MHHFCFYHIPSFDFYIVILSSGTYENILPDRFKKKKNPAGKPSDYIDNVTFGPGAIFIL